MIQLNFKMKKNQAFNHNIYTKIMEIRHQLVSFECLHCNPLLILGLPKFPKNYLINLQTQKIKNNKNKEILQFNYYVA